MVLMALVLKSFALVIFFCSLAFCQQHQQRVYIKGVLCNISEKVVHKNFSCYPKSYSRNISTVNIFLSYKFPLTNVFLEVKLFYKYGMIYREVMHTPSIDLCQLFKGKQENPMVKQLVTLLNTSSPGVLHACPYTETKVLNTTVDTRVILSMFPAGDYKFILYCAIGNESFAVVNIVGSMVSPLKENFG